jgi:hypothetical protein
MRETYLNGSEACLNGVFIWRSDFRSHFIISDVLRPEYVQGGVQYQRCNDGSDQHQSQHFRISRLSGTMISPRHVCQLNMSRLKRP